MDKIYTKKISSDPDNLVEVEKFVADVADELNFNDEIKNSLTLSVSEATSNAIVHGNKLDPKKFVKIKIIVDDDEVIVIIKDEGSGFDPTSVPNPTTPENLLKDSGRGIHIMKTFLKDLQYNFTEDGTEVILILHLK
ncbi:Serine-protein kinase RsbW [hydrothermal vent metagenome]|uniref:Serine-protein kinase RsbW n=1 Tax=hydrothermal vent metagenome TaxID=652676 RepID=A0A3B1BG62_9ZZZZ